MLDRVLRPCCPIILALTLVVASADTRAQSNGSSDVFEIRGVDVDITAETAVKAKDRAYLAGRRQALERLLRNSNSETAAVVHNSQPRSVVKQRVN